MNSAKLPAKGNGYQGLVPQQDDFHLFTHPFYGNGELFKFLVLQDGRHRDGEHIILWITVSQSIVINAPLPVFGIEHDRPTLLAGNSPKRILARLQGLTIDFQVLVGFKNSCFVGSRPPDFPKWNESAILLLSKNK